MSAASREDVAAAIEIGMDAARVAGQRDEARRASEGIALLQGSTVIAYLDLIAECLVALAREVEPDGGYRQSKTLEAIRRQTR